MKLFLDTSVRRAACGSENGASREVFRPAAKCGWTLLTISYVVDEVHRNLPALRANATGEWARLRPA